MPQRCSATSASPEAAWLATIAKLCSHAASTARSKVSVVPSVATRSRRTSRPASPPPRLTAFAHALRAVERAHVVGEHGQPDLVGGDADLGGRRGHRGGGGRRASSSRSSCWWSSSRSSWCSSTSSCWWSAVPWAGCSARPAGRRRAPPWWSSSSARACASVASPWSPSSSWSSARSVGGGTTRTVGGGEVGTVTTGRGMSRVVVVVDGVERRGGRAALGAVARLVVTVARGREQCDAGAEHQRQHDCSHREPELAAIHSGQCSPPEVAGNVTRVLQEGVRPGGDPGRVAGRPTAGGALEAAGVDALDDAAHLPVAERRVPAERRQVARPERSA